MKLSSQETVLSWNSRIFGASGILGNLLCIYFIHNVRPVEMLRFRKLMLIYSINDVVYSMVHLIVWPGFALQNDIYSFFSYRSWPTVFLGKFFLAIYAFLFIQSISILMILFLYRYSTISNVNSNNNNNNQRLECCSSMPFYFVLILTLPLIYTIPPISQIWASPGVLEHEMEQFLRLIFEQPRYNPAVFAINMNSFPFHRVLYAFSISLITILIELFIIIFCGFSVWRTLSSVQLSERTRSLQKQLLIFLVSQTTVILSCCGVQVSLFVLATVFDLPLYSSGTLMTGMLAWFPTFDAILLLTCVSTYRNEASRLWKKCLPYGHASTIATNYAVTFT